ncbi:hypothetical protein K438DRAFT_1774925 [Mycena galopus ATCC 62051]|nr:hypothetical protein K438DRAFT_1774925 [Mycena galopus ATCC 62051]
MHTGTLVPAMNDRDVPRKNKDWTGKEVGNTLPLHSNAPSQHHQQQRRGADGHARLRAGLPVAAATPVALALPVVAAGLLLGVEAGELTEGVDKPAAGVEIVSETASAALRVPAKTLMKSAGTSLARKGWSDTYGRMKRTRDRQNRNANSLRRYPRHRLSAHSNIVRRALGRVRGGEHLHERGALGGAAGAEVEAELGYGRLGVGGREEGSQVARREQTTHAVYTFRRKLLPNYEDKGRQWREHSLNLRGIKHKPQRKAHAPTIRLVLLDGGNYISEKQIRKEREEGGKTQAHPVSSNTIFFPVGALGIELVHGILVESAKVPRGEVGSFTGFGDGLEVGWGVDGRAHSLLRHRKFASIELERAEADGARDKVAANAVAQARPQPRVVEVQQALGRHHAQVRAVRVDKDVDDVLGDVNIHPAPRIVRVNQPAVGVRCRGGDAGGATRKHKARKREKKNRSNTRATGRVTGGRRWPPLAAGVLRRPLVDIV